MYRQSILLTLLLVLVAACAYVEVRPLKDEEKQGKAEYYNEGVRFFRPWPYLWITVGEKGVCQMSITYLPQMAQEYIIIPHPRMGAVSMNATLTNGWSLTALTTTADSKASEMVTSIGNLTGNAAKLATGGKNLDPAKEFGPGLYKITFDSPGYVSDLEPIFLQKGANQKPAKCKDVTPPPNSRTDKPPPKPTPGGKKPEQ